MFDKAKSIATCLVLASFGLLQVGCTPPPPTSQGKVMDTAENKSLLNEKTPLLLNLAASEFFLQNPDRKEVRVDDLQDRLSSISALLGIPPLDLSPAPKIIFRQNAPSVSPALSPSEKKTSSQFSVSLEPSRPSVGRGELVKFRANVYSSRPSPEFHFAKLHSPVADLGIEEIPVFESPPSSENEFETEFDEVGLARVVVRAYDASGATARAVATIEVTNAPPDMKVEGVPASVYRGQPITPLVQASDPEGDSVSVVAELPDDAKIEESPGVSFSLQTLGEHEVKFLAKDEYGGMTSTNLTVQVVNRPPTIQFEEDVVEAYPSKALRINPTATDPDGDSVILRVSPLAPPSKIEELADGSYICLFSKPGDYSVEFTAEDEFSATETSSLLVRVVNRPPVIEIKSENLEVSRNSKIRLAESIYDPDEDIVTSVVLCDGREYEVLPDGTTPLEFEKLGKYKAKIISRDAQGAESQAEIMISVTNASPTVKISSSSPSAYRGRPATLTATASDPDNEILLFKFKVGDLHLPPSTNNIVEISPESLGPLPVSVIVTDPEGATATDNLILQVNPLPPEITATISSSSGTRNDVFRVIPSGTCPETSEPIKDFEILSPSSSERDDESFSVTFAQLGDNNLEIKGTSATGASSTWKTNVSILNMPPVATILPPPHSKPIDRTTQVKLGLKYTDEDGLPTPASVVWETADGEIVKSEKNHALVKFGKLGACTVTARVHDADGGFVEVTEKFNVQNLPPDLEVTPPSSPFLRGERISFEIKASDPDNPLVPPAVEIILPDGSVLDWNSQDTVLAIVTLGDHPIKVRAIDSEGSFTEKEVIVKIKNSPPTVRLKTDSPSFKAGDLIRVTAEAEDLECENLSYQFEVNGVRFPISAENYLDVEFARKGKNEVSVVVTDADSGTATANLGLRLE